MNFFTSLLYFIFDLLLSKQLTTFKRVPDACSEKLCNHKCFTYQTDIGDKMVSCFFETCLINGSWKSASKTTQLIQMRFVLM